MQSNLVQRLEQRTLFGRLLRFVFAVLMVALALALTLLIAPLHQTPFPLFFAAIILVASRAGRGPGLLAVLLSAVLLDYFFLAPVYSFLSLIHI